ncbi:MAG: cupin domain-containing protein [Ginsengibacter sp.]
MEKVNITEKFSKINEYWKPCITGELNAQHIKLVKFKGAFTWHKHDNEDEMFYVIQGKFTMELEDNNIELSQGEFLIIPKGVLHRPVSTDEVCVMLFEPIGTSNTGNIINEFTVSEKELKTV